MIGDDIWPFIFVLVIDWKAKMDNFTSNQSFIPGTSANLKVNVELTISAKYSLFHFFPTPKKNLNALNWI